LMPGRIREIRFRPVSDGLRRFSGSVEALNLDAAVPVDLANSPGGRP
jgi:hypothetical protein